MYLLKMAKCISYKLQNVLVSSCRFVWSQIVLHWISIQYCMFRIIQICKWSVFLAHLWTAFQPCFWLFWRIWWIWQYWQFWQICRFWESGGSGASDESKDSGETADSCEILVMKLQVSVDREWHAPEGILCSYHVHLNIKRDIVDESDREKPYSPE